MSRSDSLSLEDRTLVNLAIGRIFRLAARPTQPGDVQEYLRCRDLIRDTLDPHNTYVDTRPNYIRDRLKGAAGD